MQNHVSAADLPNSVWYRPKTVTIDNGRLIVDLKECKLYSLTRAYRYSPHAEFLRLSADPKKLADFVRWWGPLVVVPGTVGLETLGWYNAPLEDIETYWLFQRFLRTKVDLLHAFKMNWSEPEKLQQALDAFLSCERTVVERGFERYASPLDNLHSDRGDTTELLGLNTKQLKMRLSPPGGKPLDIRQLDMAIYILHSFRIETTLFPNITSRRREVAPYWYLGSLWDAFLWMIWSDYYRQRPLGVCFECGTVFASGSAHRRKYCSLECGHRAAVRSYDREKRKRHRRGR